MSIAESYADSMVAALGTKQQQQEIEPLTPMSGAMIEHRPTGAIKVQVERDEAKILQRLKVLSSAAGERFYYRWSVKNKDGTTGWVEGPSIDCALAVARSYGNCDVDVRTQDFPDHWIFYARFTDFETGFTITRAYQQRKNQKTMKTDADRQRDIVFQIGQSKSIRNVICNALSIFTDYAFDEAKAGIVNRVGKNLEGYRTKVIARLTELKIDVARVEAVRGRAAKDWLAADVALTIAELQSINDGMATIDETYAPLNGGAVPEKEPERADFEKKPAPEKTAEQAAKDHDEMARLAEQHERDKSAPADEADVFPPDRRGAKK